MHPVSSYQGEAVLAVPKGNLILLNLGDFFCKGNMFGKGGEGTLWEEAMESGSLGGALNCNE